MLYWARTGSKVFLDQNFGEPMRPASLHRLRDGLNIGCFRVDVQRRRIVLHHSNDFPGVRRRPTGAAIAAAPGVVLQLPERHVSVSVRMGAVRIFSKTDGAAVIEHVDAVSEIADPSACCARKT